MIYMLSIKTQKRIYHESIRIALLALRQLRRVQAGGDRGVLLDRRHGSKLSIRLSQEPGPFGHHHRLYHRPVVGGCHHCLTPVGDSLRQVSGYAPGDGVLHPVFLCAVGFDSLYKHLVSGTCVGASAYAAADQLFPHAVQYAHGILCAGRLLAAPRSLSPRPHGGVSGIRAHVLLPGLLAPQGRIPDDLLLLRHPHDPGDDPDMEHKAQGPKPSGC